MIEFFTKSWPIIVAVAAAVGGLTSYWSQLLQIRELKHKIRELERNEIEKKQIIREPTTEEIERYAFPPEPPPPPLILIDNIRYWRHLSPMKIWLCVLLLLLLLSSVVIYKNRQEIQKLREENLLLKQKDGTN